MKLNGVSGFGGKMGESLTGSHSGYLRNELRFSYGGLSEAELAYLEIVSGNSKTRKFSGGRNKEFRLYQKPPD
jgi:hypothetical protein